jgi:hypothetical protein
MDTEIRHKIEVCDRAQDAEWEEIVAAISRLDKAQRSFLYEHPPGLVKALWSHFDATRGQCACTSPSHERADCTVRLIERLLLDEQSA